MEQDNFELCQMTLQLIAFIMHPKNPFLCFITSMVIQISVWHIVEKVCELINCRLKRLWNVSRGSWGPYITITIKNSRPHHKCNDNGREERYCQSESIPLQRAQAFKATDDRNHSACRINEDIWRYHLLQI